MNVQSILSKKGHTVATVAPAQTVADAADLLAERKIGALIVSNSGQVVQGIVSERDIVQALAKRGPAALQAPVTEIMTSAVVSCRPDDTLMTLMGEMTNGRFRHVPVVDQGRVVGIISIGDVVKARLDELRYQNEGLLAYIVRWAKLRR